jgi:hypothetical protein
MKRKTAQPAPVADERKSKFWIAGRIAELGARDKTVVAEILRLERAGVKLSAIRIEAKDRALELANGDEIKPKLFDEPGSMLASLHAERSHINLAIQILEANYQRADIAEAGERWAALEPEYNEQMRQLTLSLLAVEHCQQGRDEILRRAKPHATVHAGQSWPLVGRIADRDSPMQRWMVMAVQQKWISKKEHDAELAQAKAARGEKTK